VKAS